MNSLTSIIFFTALTALLSTATAESTTAMTNSSSIVGQGVAAKGSDRYNHIYSTILTTSRAQLIDAGTISKFVDLCGDNDSADQIHWLTSDFGVATVTFECADSLHPGKSKGSTSFVFTLDQRTGVLIQTK